ncbi:MAG: histidinol-phosphate transaminase [Anaerolineae bacterium]|nr:histidinol-phosphate transaminase [Anaerolineae bacterium]
MRTKIMPQSGLNEIQPYKPGKPIEEVQKQFGITDVIKLASNENQLGASPVAIAAIQRAINEINLYPDSQSYDLRVALAQKLGVSHEEITIANGADGIILEACMAYLDEGSEVITSMSSFPMYDIYTRVMRAKLIKTPLTTDYGLDLNAMLRAITEKTKIIFVCNPNNPTGTILLADAIDQFINAVPENILIILDEAYVEFVESDHFPNSIQYVRQGRPNILIMRTFSKVYGLAGIRIGFGVGIQELLAPLNTIKEPFAVNRLAQVAGIAALEDNEFVRRTVETTKAGREYFYKEFARLGLFVVPSHTNFVLADLGPTADFIINKLLESGVIIRPGKGYNLPTFARITVGDTEQNKRLVAMLEKLLVTTHEVKDPV